MAASLWRKIGKVNESVFFMSSVFATIRCSGPFEGDGGLPGCSGPLREIWKARPMNMVLDKLVMKNRGIRSDQVRTEGKLLAWLLRGRAMIAP